MTNTAVVRVTVRPENGGFAAESPDMFGLNLWAATLDALRDRVREGIKVLYQANYGRKVEVDVARAADFSHVAVRPNADTNFVVAPIC